MASEKKETVKFEREDVLMLAKVAKIMSEWAKKADSVVFAYHQITQDLDHLRVEKQKAKQDLENTRKKCEIELQKFTQSQRNVIDALADEKRKNIEMQHKLKMLESDLEKRGRELARAEAAKAVA